MNQLTEGYAGLYPLLQLVFNIFLTHLYYRKVFKLLLHRNELHNRWSSKLLKLVRPGLRIDTLSIFPNIEKIEVIYLRTPKELKAHIHRVWSTHEYYRFRKFQLSNSFSIFQQQNIYFWCFFIFWFIDWLILGTFTGFCYLAKNRRRYIFNLDLMELF